ncbi:hypothetical protein JHK82_052470 [Glycine max]|nr:hypothetical protein JHK82_052470 [Glycine max]
MHFILSLSSNNSLTKHTLQLNNGQTWLIHTSSPISLNHSLFEIASTEFSGIIRITVLPDSDPKYEVILNRFCSCYLVSRDAAFTKPLCVEYKWEKKGWGELLMLAHLLHLQLLNDSDCGVTVLHDLKYRSIDGLVGDSWLLKTNPVSVTWHSTGGIREEFQEDIFSTLSEDVDGLNPLGITTTSFGFGVYNNHYNLGYFLYGIAMLAKIGEGSTSLKPILFTYGRNQKSTSEAVNACWRYIRRVLVNLQMEEIRRVLKKRRSEYS